MKFFECSLAKITLRFPLVGEEEPISSREQPEDRINLHHSIKDVFTTSTKALKDVHKYVSQKVTSAVEDVGNKVSRPLSKIIAPVFIIKDRLEHMIGGQHPPGSSECQFTGCSETPPYKDIQSGIHEHYPHPDDHPVFHHDSSFTPEVFPSLPEKEDHVEDTPRTPVVTEDVPTGFDPIEGSDFIFAEDELKKELASETSGKGIALTNSGSDIDIRFGNDKGQLSTAH